MKPTLATRIKMRAAKLGKVGSKSNNWKGGKPYCSCGKQLSAYHCKLCAKCRGKIGYNKGIKLSIKTRERMSEVMKGQKRFLGKHHSIETVKKISQARIGKNTGSGNPSWKGGISSDLSHYARQYRNRKLGALGSHTFVEWEELKMKYGYMCLCCKRVEPEIVLTEDHIVPLTKGGSDNIENIQPLCRNCNSRKHTKIINFLPKVELTKL